MRPNFEWTFRRFLQRNFLGRIFARLVIGILCFQMLSPGLPTLWAAGNSSWALPLMAPAGVPAGGPVTLNFAADAFGAGSPATTLTFNPCFDTSARSKAGKVQLTWPAVAGATGYQIYRGADADPVVFSRIGEVPATLLTALDLPPANERTWLYAVGALTPAGLCFSGVTAAHPTAARGVANYPPVIYSPAVTSAAPGVLYSYDVNAADPNGDVLSYRLLAGPAGMTIDPNSGLIAWGPQPGTFNVMVEARDPAGATDIQTYQLSAAVANTPPVANAGPDQAATVTQTVMLDGSASTDLDGDPLTRFWSFVSRPAGSVAALSDAAALNPTFVLDRPGNYVVQLIVNDGIVNSAPDTVTISTRNTLPVASAGSDQSTSTGLTVTLDGSASSDVDGDPLTYFWSFASLPAGSAALLSSSAAAKPAFTLDRPGNYEVRLVVNDGTADSAPDFVTVSTVNSPPVANAGANQSTPVGQTVTLDGSASTDVDGDPLTYFWSFTSRPAGSAAVLSDPAAAKPIFTVDRPGNYVVQLIVNDGTVDGLPVTVTVSTSNTPPVANAGPDQSALVTQTVTLNGGLSSDVDGNPLTYAWSIISRPAGSSAALSDPAAAGPTFVLDRPGSYVVQLIVNDGFVNSAPDTVTVSTLNSPPVANAGANQSMPVGQTVTLDGSASTDVDGDTLTYFWSFTSRPAGSAAVLSDATVVTPAFSIDLPGTYVVQLIVNDGQVDGPLDTVTISTVNSAPVANAGPDQSALVTQTVTLNGGLSSDVDGNPLNYAWSITSRPAGSSAALSDPAAAGPTFVLDRPGSYVVQLIVNDGFVNSVPDTVTVSTLNSPPVANAGANQSTPVGQTVTLDGTASTDVDGDPLTYLWSFTSRPAGSAAVLSDPAAARPTFAVDRPGNYVVQLIVNDGTVNSAPDSVTVSTINSPPVANAGTDQSTPVGRTITVNGSASTDVDGDALTYFWSITSRPAGSTVALTDAGAVMPLFNVDKPGAYVLQLIVNDGQVDSAPDTMTVSTVNSPPVAHAGPDQSARVGQRVTLDGNQSSDVDGDALTFSWSFLSRPAGSTATLSTATAASPEFILDRFGDYVVQLIVSDGQVNSIADTVTISTLNTKPVAGAGADRNVETGTLVTLDGSASADADGTPLTYRWSLTTKPAGSLAVLSSLTAVNPSFTADLSGIYVAQLIVNDGTEDSDPDTITLTAAPRDVTVPNVVGLARATGEAGILAAGLTVGAVAQTTSPTVPAGNIISQAPIGGTIVAAGTPVNILVSLGPPPVLVPDVVGLAQAAAAAAITAAQLTVGTITTANHPTVPAGHVISQAPVAGTPVPQGSAVAITVSLGVGAPVLTSIAVSPGNLTLSSGQSQQYTATGTFSDGSTQNLTATGTWSSNSLPVANVTQSGLAIALESGTATISATKDGITGSASLTVNIPALASILVTPGTSSILVGSTQTFTANGIFTDGTSQNLTTLATWESTSTATASISNQGLATGAAGGTTTIRATKDGITGTASLTVSARVTETTPPAAVITSPVNDATVTSPTDVIGTATDANFLKYMLEIAPVGDSNFTKLAEGTAPVTNGVLGRFDPSMLLNDIYTVRLTVFDKGGNTTSTSVNYQAARDAKVGIFTLTFQDLDIPLSGLPITVNRVYDSRDKGKGDFGIGWRLDVQALKLRANRLQGEGWQITVTGSVFNRRYNLVPIGQHKISLTLPEGKVEEFDLTPTPTSSALVPLEAVTAVYTPRPATTGKLEVLDGTDLWIIDAQPGPVTLYDFGNFDEFNPQLFRYTSADGRIFIISKAGGVQSVTEPNGNTLSFGPNGIIHSSGKSISFTRDAQGRITQITDPNGSVQRYTYDTNGDLANHTDAVNNTTRFLYNLSHGLLEVRDPLGRRSVRNEYDAEGRLIAHVDGDGKRIDYTHNVGAKQEIISNRLGALTVSTYDQQGNVLSLTDALGNTTNYTYDANGNRLTESDPLGNTRTYTYDARNNPLSVRDALGGVTTYSYNGNGQLLSTTDPLGRVSTNTFDARGNRLSSTDPSGQVTAYAYDASGNLTTITDPLGRISRAEYDANGRVTRQVDPLGNQTLLTYDANGNTLTQTTRRTDSTGNLLTLTSQNIYDSANRLLKTTYPDGSFTEIVYDALGRVDSTTDKNGNRTDNEYSASGKIAKTIHGDGTSESFSYDAEGNRIATTDRGMRTTRYEYDALKRLVRTILPDGGILVSEYDSAGRTIASIDQMGNRTRFQYDAVGRRTKVIDPLGHETIITYDARGNQTSVTDPNGGVTQFQYDANDSRIRTTYPDGRFGLVTYDATRKKTSETDPAGNTTNYSYDVVGRLTRVTDPLGQITAFTYDEVGNRISQTDANGHITRWAYDNSGKVMRRTLPLGTFETFTYDANGNTLSRTDFAGRTTNLSYDSQNRLTSKTHSDGSTATFNYSASGKLQRVTDSRGVTLYGYDVMDRLTSVQNPNGSTISYAYDSRGNRLSVTVPSGTTSFLYDGLGRLTTVNDPAIGVASYAYDAAGNRTSLTQQNGAITEYTYDSRHRLTQLRNRRADGSVISSYLYTLGAAGNRTRVAEHTGRTVDYAYDALFRLSRETITDPGAGNRTIAYTYDPVGNRLSMTSDASTSNYTYDANDRLLTDGTSSYSYDANGNVVTKVAGAVTTTYSWNVENQLTSVVTPASAITYKYDHTGTRIESTVNGVVKRYLVDASRALSEVAEERDAAGALLVRYVRGSDLLAQIRSGATRFYHFDGQNSTRQLTDTAATVTDTYSFDAFGAELARTGATTNDYLYNGQQFDANAGFYYLRARYYNANTGTFVSMDPFAGNVFDPPSLHKYNYAKNSPVDLSDPSGLYFGGVIGVSISIGIIGILSSIAVGSYWAYKVFDYLPPDAFQSLPDAAMLGYALSYAPSRDIARISNPLAQGLAFGLALTSGLGGVEMLIPFQSPLQAWFYPYYGASVSLPVASQGLTRTGYGGLVWNVKQPGDYTGAFYSFSGTRIPARFKGRVPPNVTIFSGPPSGGAAAGSYGLSGAFFASGGFSSGIQVSRTYYLDPLVLVSPGIPSIPRFPALSFNPGALLPTWQDVVEELFPSIPIPSF